MNKKKLRIIILLMFLIGGVVFLFQQDFLFSIGCFITSGFYFFNMVKNNE